MRSNRQTLAVLLVCLTAAGVAAGAERFRLTHTFVPGDTAPGDLFGSAVELSDDLAVIRSHNEYGAPAGQPPNQTHIFRQTAQGGWNEVQVITLEGAGFWIGQEIALDGEELVLGSSSGADIEDLSIDFFGPSDQPGEGWIPRDLERIELQNPRDRADPNLPLFRAFRRGHTKGGRTVDADDGYAIVNSPLANTPRDHEGQGAALIYERSESGTWRESTALFHPLGRSLGLSVAIDNRVAVTDGFFQYGRDDPTELVVFERNDFGDWDSTAVLSGPGTFKIIDMEVHGETIVASSVDGEATVYEKQGNGQWELVADLRAADFAPNFIGDRAAWSVVQQERIFSLAIEDDLIAAGVFDGLQPHVKLFRRSDAGDWLLSEVIPAPDLATAPNFGWSLSLDDGRLLVGSSSSGFPDFDTPGAAFLFVQVPEPHSGLLVVVAGGMWGVSLRGRRFWR